MVARATTLFDLPRAQKTCPVSINLSTNRPHHVIVQLLEKKSLRRHRSKLNGNFTLAFLLHHWTLVVCQPWLVRFGDCVKKWQQFHPLLIRLNSFRMFVSRKHTLHCTAFDLLQCLALISQEDRASAEQTLHIFPPRTRCLRFCCVS